MPLTTPPLASPSSVLVDWLELSAFAHPYGMARLDEVLASFREQQDEHDDDFGFADQENERIRAEIENEVEFRISGCHGGYPFQLSDDGEELQIIEGWQNSNYSVYLICLITSHLTGSEILEKALPASLIQRLRNRIFQIVSVLAMSGWARGPALSVGWPRESGERILSVLKRAEDLGAGVVAREEPGIYVRPKEKDGGIDVISWTATDRPPPPAIYYGQVASGRDYEGKPVEVHVPNFEDNYMESRPRCNRNYATLIPFREVDVVQWFHAHGQHKCLLDRTRIPELAQAGLGLAGSGISIDEVDQIPHLHAWVDEVRKALVPD